MEKTKTAIWERLKKMQCPKCNALLSKNENIMMYECRKGKCDFKISYPVFDTVVTNLYKPKGLQVGMFDNLSELNNL